jgi:hypothetical protein
VRRDAGLTPAQPLEAEVSGLKQHALSLKLLLLLLLLLLIAASTPCFFTVVLRALSAWQQLQSNSRIATAAVTLCCHCSSRSHGHRKFQRWACVRALLTTSQQELGTCEQIMKQTHTQTHIASHPHALN